MKSSPLTRGPVKLTEITGMFIKLLIISALIVILALALLGIRILLKPGGRFPDTHVGHNREMQKRGIGCARNSDIGCNPVDSTDGCPACGRIVTAQK